MDFLFLAVDAYARASFTLLTFRRLIPRFTPQADFARSASGKIRHALAAFFLRIFTLSSSTMLAIQFQLAPILSVRSFEGCFNEKEGIHS